MAAMGAESIREVAKGTRSEMLEQERLMIKTSPGPANHETWRTGPDHKFYPELGEDASSGLKLEFKYLWLLLAVVLKDPVDIGLALGAVAVAVIGPWAKDKQARRARAAEWWLSSET